MTDGQTDGQTDRQTLRDSIDCICIASRSKNQPIFLKVMKEYRVGFFYGSQCIINIQQVQLDMIALSTEQHRTL